MTEDELAELMEEPAGGANHGWTKNGQGGWTSLQTTDLDPPKDPSFVARPYHGREYGYRKMKCRCVLCRAWKALDNAERYQASKGHTTVRKSDVS